MPIGNILSCTGFAGGNSFTGACTMAKVVLVVIFFIGAIAGKWLEGMNFNKLYGIIGGLLFALIAMTLTAAPKWGMVGGIIGLLVGGFLAGQWIGGGDEYGY